MCVDVRFQIRYTAVLMGFLAAARLRWRLLSSRLGFF
jgi:hypothetical protein